MPTMPNVVGLKLGTAQASLQAAGVLNLNTLGYFSTWPITVSWQAGTGKPPSTVTAQTPNSGNTIAANGAVALSCAEFPIAVVYP